MELMKSEVYLNVNRLQELLTCGLDIWTWYYDSDGNLISTNSPERVFDKIMEKTGCKAYMLERSVDSPVPVILSAKLGLMWGAASYRQQGKVESIFVIGPVFNTSVSAEAIDLAIEQGDVPVDWRFHFKSMMKRIPVLTSVTFFQYVLMLHYCAAGEKLSRGALHFQKEEEEESTETASGKQDRHQTWMAEQALLNNVREGNLNFQAQLERAGLLSNGVRVSADMPTTQAMLSEAVFVSLCTRAAIEGGMSPDSAYTLGDSYIQSLVSCKSFTEMKNIGHTMYEDFIVRVHTLRTERNQKYSPEIQSCKDYIDMHPQEPLTLEELASHVWYSKYYLSRKFREEVGCGINEYIQKARIECAKPMLSWSGKQISEIAEELHFCSSSHFSDVFRKFEGELPQSYRQRTRKL